MIGLSLSLVFSLSVKPPWPVGLHGYGFLSSSDPTFRVVGFWVFFLIWILGGCWGGFGWIWWFNARICGLIVAVLCLHLVVVDGG